MGEIFRRNRPHCALAWTGERLVTEVKGPIEGEHLHRYFIARELCRGKRVLDIACGEGYGSAILAQSALQVTGVEGDLSAIQHAAQNYQAPNLEYIHGDATLVPVASETIDVVVSFETLEHFNDHTSFFSEVRRVLKRDGLLILSTPDFDVYSRPGTQPNRFHVRELSRDEFVIRLRTTFPNLALYRQRIMVGSVVLPDLSTSPDTSESLIFEQRDEDTFEAHRYLPRAPYLLSLASSVALPPLGSSLFVQAQEPGALPREIEVELTRLQNVEKESSDHANAIQELHTRLSVADNELQRLAAELARREAAEIGLSQEIGACKQAQSALQYEREQLYTELEHHRASEATAQERCDRHEAAMALLHDQIYRLQAVEIASQLALRAEAAPANDTAAHELSVRIAELTRERDELSEKTESLSRQLQSSSLIARQQSVIVQRLETKLMVQYQASLVARDSQHVPVDGHPETSPSPNSNLHQFEAVTSELNSVKEDLQRQIELTNKIAGLIIPVWLRRIFPPALRNSARAVKRSLAS